MKISAGLRAALPVAVVVLVMLVIVTTGNTKGRPPREPKTPQITVTNVTPNPERDVQTEAYVGWVVRVQGSQRVLGPFYLDADCYGAARMLNGARPGSFMCRLERE